MSITDERILVLRQVNVGLENYLAEREATITQQAVEIQQLRDCNTEAREIVRAHEEHAEEQAAEIAALQGALADAAQVNEVLAESERQLIRDIADQEQEYEQVLHRVREGHEVTNMLLRAARGRIAELESLRAADLSRAETSTASVVARQGERIVELERQVKELQRDRERLDWLSELMELCEFGRRTEVQIRFPYYADPEAECLSLSEAIDTAARAGRSAEEAGQ